MIDAVIFDIDGTLADIAHRLHHIIPPENTFGEFKKDWEGFHSNCIEDKPIEPIINILDMYARDGYKVILCTGRSERNRGVTNLWCTNHNIAFDELLMRADDNYESDYIIKKRMLDELLVGHKIHAVFEDRKRVVQMYRENNIKCLQVKEGDY